MKKQLIFLAFILLSDIVSAKKDTDCSNQELFPKKSLSTDTENANITADRIESDNDNSLLTGNVSLDSAEFYLSADQIKTNKTQKTSYASGHIKFQNKKMMLIGNKVTSSKQGEKIHSVFDQVSYYYLESKANGYAKKITDNGTEQTLESMSYSLCPNDNTDWNIEAKKVTINEKNNQGIAKNVTFKVLGMPIFYAPYYTWKLKGKASGFLVPNLSFYSSSVKKTTSYQVRIPYYFNIAPDRDFLLTFNRLSTKGTVVEGNYRQLLKNGMIKIETHYLNNSRINSKNRWLLNAKSNFSLNDQTNFNLTINRVSDKNYIKEIALNNTIQDKEGLMSEIEVNHHNKKNDFNVKVTKEKEQLLVNSVAKYTRALEIQINKKITKSNTQINLLATRTKFKHNDLTKNQATRSHMQAAFIWNIKNNTYLLKPKLNISKTNYSIKNNKNNNRSIVSFGFDSELLLKKEINLFGKSIVQTLTPKLTYNYTQDKNQSTLPNFDSEKQNMSYKNLFSGKKFTGIDRIGKANDLVFGLESDFINKNTGETYLALKIAQSRHFSSTKTQLNGTLVTQKNYSNIIANADFYLDKFSFDHTLEYDPYNKKSVKSSSALNYISNPKKTFSLTHINDNGKKTIGTNITYPLNQKINLFAGINHSLSYSSTNQKTTGFTYQSCCLTMHLAYFKDRTSAGVYDNTIKLELSLNGLSSSDSSLTKRLKKEMPNYLKSL